jgi:hypothetical protein
MLKGTNVLVIACALAVGCVAETEDEIQTEDRIAEITENLLAAGYTEEQIEVREVAPEEILSVNGVEVLTPGPQVYVDGDVHVTLEASRALLDAEDEDVFRMWRTPGLVNNNTTICLVRASSWVPGEVGPPVYGLLTANQSAGVVFARDNYNLLPNMNLQFEVREGVLNINGGLFITPAQQVGCNYYIGIIQNWNGIGGSSGFPSGNGAPYGGMFLSGNASDQVYEHIATHEIGHCIGLRHSDWKTRASCGQNLNEGQAGASQIPGTVDQTTSSIMASCLTSLNTNGEFYGEDSLAISTLY